MAACGWEQRNRRKQVPGKDSWQSGPRGSSPLILSGSRESIVNVNKAWITVYKFATWFQYPTMRGMEALQKQDQTAPVR